MSLVNLKLGPLTTMEWVNDALMAIFFLFVGLEVKRELVSGSLIRMQSVLCQVLLHYLVC